MYYISLQVKDRFFIGGETTTMAKGSESHDVDFTFGCQTKETGLFRTQMENGIMGLSADAKTLPNTLLRANLTATNAFALCFLPTGGVMSLGGSHPQIKQGPMGYAQMTKKSGYFTVKVLSMFLRKAASSELTELKIPMTKLNSGKGVIVDSGTTDTYLPSAISSAFQSLFKKLCGTSYTRSTFSISEEEVKALPTVVLHLQKWHPSGKSTEYVQVEMPPTRYLELSNKAGKAGKPMYVFRLYLTERSGGVLGANFMTGQNVEFDQKQQRVGFAPSHCKTTGGALLYEGITKPVKMKKHRLRKLDYTQEGEEGEEDVLGGIVSVESIEQQQQQEQPQQLQGRARRRLSATSLRASGPCNAQCNGNGNGDGDGRQEGVTTSSSVSVRTSAGYMPATATAGEAAGGREGKSYAPVNTARATTSITGKIPCALACDTSTGQQVRLVSVTPEGEGEGEKCPVQPWARCGENCLQTRSLPIDVDADTNTGRGRAGNSSSGSGSGSHLSPLSPACLLLQTASRQCWRELCPFRPSQQCALRLQLSLPLFKAKRWNALWKEDVLSAVALTLKVWMLYTVLCLCDSFCSATYDYAIV